MDWILTDLIIWGWSLLDKVRSEDETDSEPFFPLNRDTSPIYSLPVRPPNSFQPTEEQLLPHFVLIYNSYFNYGIIGDF